MQALEKELEHRFHINKKDDLTMSINLSPDKDWVFYHGHFPGLPILPAYAITEISVFFAEIFMQSAASLATLHGLRMRNPIIPGMQLRLELIKDNKSNRFQMTWKSELDDKLLLASIDFEVAPEQQVKDLVDEKS